MENREEKKRISMWQGLALDLEQKAAAERQLNASPAAVELRDFLNAKAIGDIDRLRPYLAEEIVYINRGMSFELKGKEAVANRLARLTFTIREGADAVFAMVMGPEDADPAPGTGCIALKYVRDENVSSLAFFQLDDEEKICRLETVSCIGYSFVLLPPPGWSGWSERVVRTTVKYSRDGAETGRETTWPDGTPVRRRRRKKADLKIAPATAPYRCPECGKEMEIPIWESVNTKCDCDPEDVISGELFTVTCSACGHSGTIAYPMLYHDVDRRVMIWYEGFLHKKDFTDTAKMTMGLGYTVRLVRTQEELREKAAIFHMGLDDRAVEVMKFLLRDQIDAVTGEKELKAVYCMLDGEDAMFEIFTEDGDLYPLTGALEPCRKLQAAIQEDLPERDEALTVDRAWAEEFLNSLKK